MSAATHLHHHIPETDVRTIESAFAAQRAFFDAHNPIPLSLRKKRLRALRAVVVRREQDINEALRLDFRKCAFETYVSETSFVLKEIDDMLANMDEWAAPRKVKTRMFSFPSSDYIFPEPWGVNLIISPWNYPFQLSLVPLIDAIASGNCVILKPSELSWNTSNLMEEMLAEVFDPGHAAVIHGGVPTATALLQQSWDHIFFTGSPVVGRVVMQAAAQHLIPVSLELGGKSPAIVDETADIAQAAGRIGIGKFLNGGQTCVAPDYVLVHASVKDELIRHLQAFIRKSYGDDPQQSPDFPRIINHRNYARICRFLHDGEIVHGGQHNENELYIAPTLLDGVQWGDHVMKEEIFGPVLPILSYEDFDETLTGIRRLPKPLALYIFSARSERHRRVLRQVSAGNVCINDTVMFYANTRLPLGGAGNSGIGRYRNQAGFEAFSNMKSVMKRATWPDVTFYFPPYEGKYNLIKRILKLV